MSNGASWPRVKALFQTLAERPRSEAEAALRALEGEEPAAVAEVRGLLDAHREGGGAIGEALARESEDLAAAVRLPQRVGHRAGSYSLLRLLGEGGMGEVWLAERADDVFHKQVAVKLVRSGLLTASAHERFRTEREALARLEHPNIVRLLDGGTDEDGVPYLVMEYVDGEPIERYCEARALKLRDRMRLFIQVCSAVEEAHRNLIVHRDIKPGNVLVTVDGTVKLLDFGIAKLLESGGSSLTRTALAPATPAFASPEQLAGAPVTTATDVYALGVLLYRLIAGRHPYPLEDEPIAEVARVIRDTQPEQPSHAVATAATSPEPAAIGLPLPSLHARRAWSRELRGDLDAIVLTALRKEPARRYGSAALFALDLARYLEGLPVSATPDSLGYRAGKFMRRHRAGVAAAAVILASLLGGLLATVQAARIAREERDRARLERAKAERINAFLQQMLASADPSWYSAGYGKRGDIRVVDVLDQAESKVDSVLAEHPEVRAELHETIGKTYLGLGSSAQAARHFEAAVALYTTLKGEQNPKVAEALYYLGAAKVWNGDLPGAERLYRRSIEILRRVDPRNANLPFVLQDLAGLRAKAKPAEAESLLKEALALARLRSGAKAAATRSIYSTLGQVVEARGDLDQAERISRGLIATCRQSNDRWLLSGELLVLGKILEKRGRHADAEAAGLEAVALAREIYGEGHPTVAATSDFLADVHCRQRRYDLAEKDARVALAIWHQRSPDTPALRVPGWTALGEALLRTARPDEAAGYLTEALTTLRGVAEPDPARRAKVESLLAECQAKPRDEATR